MKTEPCPRCDGKGWNDDYQEEEPESCVTCNGLGRAYVYSWRMSSSGGVSVLTKVVGHRDASEDICEAITDALCTSEEDPLNVALELFEVRPTNKEKK